MDLPPGSHKPQEERLLRPKTSSPARHSTESAPPAFENRTPSSHPRVVFSEADEPQADPDRVTGKGRADIAEHPHQALKDCECHQPWARHCISNEWHS